VGITNQREPASVWDRTTVQAIYNAIVWQDRRTASFCERPKANGCEQMIQHRTGLVIDAYFSSINIAWILDNVPGPRSGAGAGRCTRSEDGGRSAGGALRPNVPVPGADQEYLWDGLLHAAEHRRESGGLPEPFAGHDCLEDRRAHGIRAGGKRL